MYNTNSPDNHSIDYYETHPNEMAEIDRAHDFWNAMFIALADNVWKYQIRMSRMEFEIAMESIEEAMADDAKITNAIDDLNREYNENFNYAPADAKAKIDKFWECQESRWDVQKRTIVWGGA
jgi:hypothetical protein